MDSTRFKRSEPEGRSNSRLGRIIGSGEMADLVRAHDWGSTPLGPIETWSIELLTIVNLTLCSPSPARTMWGPDFILIYNDAYRPIPGPRHPAALGRSARDVYGESWHVVGPLLEKAFATGETFFYEKLLVPLPTESGIQNFYLNYSFNPIYEGNRIAGLFGPLQDVTGEVIAARKLEESEARATRILQSIGDAVIVTDAEGSITRMNPIAEALTGCTLEEAVGQPLTAVFRIVREDTGLPVESPVERVKRLGTVVGLANHTILLAKDGTKTHIDDSGAPIRNEEGELTGIVLVFRDINERRVAERERDRVEQALMQSEKLAAVGRLASSIAHEINNPLEAVTNLIYLARQRALLPEVQEYLESADRELRRVSAIANQTLRFHRQSTHPRSVRCDELIGSVLSIFQGRFLNTNIIVETRNRVSPSVKCFEGEIRQVLSNLVANAIDAMQPRGGRLLVRCRVATHWKTSRHGVAFTVADTGGGMSQQTLQRIFDAFFTTKDMNGTGLGLWISKDIVERHGGELRVRSSQRPSASGTVFVLFLPVTQESRS